VAARVRGKDGATLDSTIAGLLAAGNPASTALAWDGEDGPSALTYDELRTQVERLAGQLRATGIRAGDRIAYAVPNGPEAAVLFLAAANASRREP
jgi:acyl-coenzyme A synthetase/AMP-(fatty) acid ligase